MKKVYQFFLYLSIAFLVIYLFRIDYIQVNQLNFDFIRLGFSTFFLLIGFIISALSWRKSLMVYGHSISYKQSLNTHGLPIFAKYIPGKLWTVLGRSALVSQHTRVSMKDASYISLNEQLIFVYSAIILTAWLPYKVLSKYYLFGYIGLVVLISLFLFSHKINQALSGIVGKMLKKKWDIPFINFKKLYPVFIYCFVYWFCWMTGFYFLISSVVPDPLDYRVAFVFPFSAVVGLLVIFAPGGIGVREGIMILALVYLGLSEEISITLAVLSRIWFLFGEVFIFLLALFLKKPVNKTKG